MKKRKSPPYPFLTEALSPLAPAIRPMFSGYAIYIGDKIMAMLRDSLKAPADNGLWLVLSETGFNDATRTPDRTLKKDFPSLRPIALLGGKIGHWLLIPADSPTFETESLHACDLILRHDPRLGRIPQSRQPKPTRRNSR